MIQIFTGSTIGNWGSVSNWTSGSIPQLDDIVIFDSLSPTCSLNITGTCSSIDFSNYNKQFKFNANILNVYGTVSFGPNMGYSFSTSTTGYNLYQISNTSSNVNFSITTNGATVGVPFIIYGGGSTTTHNITGNLNMSENLSISAGGGAIVQTVNGSTISCLKNLRFNDIGGNSSNNGTTGSATILMIGTGNIGYAGGSNNGLNNSLTINTSGTITLLNSINIKGNLNWISGNSAGAFNFLWNASATFSNIPFNSGAYASFGIGTNGNYILNLVNDFYTTKQITTVGGQLNNGNIYTVGGINNVTNTLSGSSLITITGTSSSSSSNVTATTGFNNNVVINTPGIVALSGIWGGSTFLYTAGNVNPTTFTVAGSNATITMPSNKFTTVSIGSLNQTITLLANWNMTTLSLGTSNISFTGSSVWTTDTLSNISNAATSILTLKNGFTYSVLKQIIIGPSNYSNYITIQSGLSASYSNLYLAPGATQTIYSLNMKDVNNVGTPLWIFNPTYSNSTNIWNLNYLSPQQTTINSW